MLSQSANHFCSSWLTHLPQAILIEQRKVCVFDPGIVRVGEACILDLHFSGVSSQICD